MSTDNHRRICVVVVGRAMLVMTGFGCLLEPFVVSLLLLLLLRFVSFSSERMGD